MPTYEKDVTFTRVSNGRSMHTSTSITRKRRLIHSRQLVRQFPEEKQDQARGLLEAIMRNT